MARIIAVANQKGGVGKTTTAVNLAACLAASEQSTLLVDCDSQANATAAIGFPKDPSRRTLYQCLILNEPFDKIVQKSQVDGLDVVPADKNLAGAAVELVVAENREYKLQAVLNEIRDRYKFIDSSSRNSSTWNVLRRTARTIEREPDSALSPLAK